MTTTNPSPELANLIASVPDADWDKNLIEQAVYLFGEDGRAFSMNTFRDLLPPMAWGVTGRVFLSMLFRKNPPIREVDFVRSTSASTHCKRIGVYVLTAAGYRAAHEWHQRHQGAAA